MLTRLSAVVQDVFVVAPGVLQCISEDRHSVECSFGVDTTGKSKNGRCEPGGIESDRAEGDAEDVTNKADLGLARYSLFVISNCLTRITVSLPIALV